MMYERVKFISHKCTIIQVIVVSVEKSGDLTEYYIADTL